MDYGQAKSNNLVDYALIQNRAGNFVDPSPQNVADAVAGAQIPADLRYTIVDAPGEDAYPIAGTTWMLAYVNQTDPAKGKALAYFLWWAAHEGQSYAEDIYSAPLPHSIVERSEAQIRRMKCDGKPCFP
jgi:phosphate transport system substrate-binding protein